MSRNNGTRYFALAVTLLALGYLFWAMTPGPLAVQLSVAFLFAITAVLAFHDVAKALLVIMFLIPLAGIVPRLFGSPSISVLLFAFLGLGCGSILRDVISKREPAGRRAPFTIILLGSVALVAASGTITVLRLMNFFPFSAGAFHDWIVNSVGTLTTEAVNNTVTVGLAYITGIALLLTASREFGSLAATKRVQMGKRIAWALVIAGSAANLFALWQLLSHKLLIIGFITGTYTDSNALGVCSALILPYCIGLILVSEARAQRPLVACALLLVAVTVLARSRAGVLSIILFLIAFAIWLWRLDRRGQGPSRLAKRSLRGFAALAAIMLVMLFLLDISHLRRLPVAGDALMIINKPTTDSLTFLLQHRVHQWPEALRMCRDFPWTGVGLGAYILELPNYYFLNVGKLFVIDTAGNLPLQIASELGILGLVLVLLFASTVVRSSYRLLFTNLPSTLQSEQKLAGPVALGVLASFASLLFGAHVLFFEFNYLLAVSIALVLAASHSLDPHADHPAHMNRRAKAIPCLLAAAIGTVSVIFLFESLGPLSIEQRKHVLGWQFDYGIYKKELWDGKFHFWWMQKEAQITITAKGDVLHFALFCAHPDADRRPIVVSISTNLGTQKSIKLTRDRWREVSLDLKTRPGDKIALKICVDRTFNPRKLGISNDGRDLGVAIAKIRWSHSAAQ
ncbi:MAG: hypothetical protein DRH70_05830 [Candidatus Coatesbacteria bacterium]|nr:MAG: hypothetical protein DRH70_05830 [Candidatus Coatesbacteria bacterium]